MSGPLLAAVLFAIASVIYFFACLAIWASRQGPPKDPNRDVEYRVQLHRDEPAGRVASWAATTVKGEANARRAMRELYVCNQWGGADGWPVVTMERV